jgi:hypothetical protein
MTDAGDRTLDQAMASLREAAGELRSALAPRSDSGEEDRESTQRLKADVARFGEAATAALSTLGHDLDQQRAAIGASVDRERAEHAVTEMKSALAELTAMASALASEIASSAAGSVKQADPEITKAVRALDDVIASGAAWINSVLDSPRVEVRDRDLERRPPLDDL